MKLVINENIIFYLQDYEKKGRIRFYTEYFLPDIIAFNVKEMHLQKDRIHLCEQFAQKRIFSKNLC